MTFDLHPPVSKLKGYWTAARPKTLLVCFVPILVGTFLSPFPIHYLDWKVFLSLLFTAFFLQMGTNLINDAVDFKTGADSKDRLGPIRMIQSGQATSSQIMWAGYVMFFFAAVASLFFLYKGGWLFLLLLTFSIGSGIAYTAGPYPLAYKGLGELFLMIFYGYVATVSSFYLQTGYVDPLILLIAFQMGSLAIVPLAINNFRDMKQDARVKKKTLPVRFGKKFARYEITLCLLIPYLLNGIWLYEHRLLTFSISMLSLPMAINIIRGIFRYDPSQIYNRYLAESSLQFLVFGILTIIGYRL